MPYYAPPGGAATAAVARSLMGLGVATIQHRAAAGARLRRRSQVPGRRFMSGMGMGTVHAGAARGAALIRRQAGFFMGPGGGPGGGPFQIPGYMSGMGFRSLRGMGDDGSGIDTTSYDFSNQPLIAPSDSGASSSPTLFLMPGVPSSDLSPTMSPVSSTLTPNIPVVSSNTQDIANLATGVGTANASALPAASGITSLLNSLFGAKPASYTSAGVPVYSAGNSLTSILPVVAVAGIGLALLSGMGKKRR